MYKLNTLEGRLRALADKHTLCLHTEFNGVIYINMHTIPQHGHMLGRTEFSCTLKPRTSVTAVEFDSVCDSLGFGGVVRDELRIALFGAAAPAEETSINLMDTKPTALFSEDFWPRDLGGKPC